MPLTLNVGLSRKIGEANYGSRGASVNFEADIEATLIREPEQLHQRIRYLFRLAKQAVEDELANGAQSSTDTNGGNGPAPRTDGRQATQSQVRAIHAIANRQRLDLPRELHSRFGVDRPDDLSIGDASEFIDLIKSQSNGNGGRR